MHPHQGQAAEQTAVGAADLSSANHGCVVQASANTYSTTAYLAALKNLGRTRAMRATQQQADAPPTDPLGAAPPAVSPAAQLTAPPAVPPLAPPAVTPATGAAPPFAMPAVTPATGAAPPLALPAVMPVAPAAVAAAAAAAATAISRDDATFLCINCGLKPMQDFDNSCLTWKKHRCKNCIKIKNSRYYEKEKNTTIKERRERQRICRGFRPFTRIQLADIFEIHGRECYITHRTGRPLSLIRADPAVPFSPTNAVPVLARLSKEIDHLPTEALSRWRANEALRVAKSESLAAIDVEGTTVAEGDHGL